MLLGNYSLFNMTPGRWLAGSTAAVNPQARSNWGTTGSVRNFALQDGATAALQLVAYPTGYTNGWMMPLVAGSVSSHYNAVGSTAAYGQMAAGINITGTATGLSTAEAIGQLILSAIGQAFGSTTLTGNIVASLAASGTAAGSSSLNATIGALTWGRGEAVGETTASLISYAVGHLAGSVTPFTELSPENLAAAVWNSLLANYQQSGSMGEALMGAGGGTTPASIWQYIVEDTLSAEDMLRLVASALAGKVNGAAGSEIRFRDLADTKDRIAATVDEHGNRTAVVLDAD